MFVLVTVGENDTALKHVSAGLKGDGGDRDVVLAAVGQNGGALQHASKTLKCDREMVLAAMTQDGQVE
jgi:hypothetical protein